jgi:exodeoxyribonuclease VII large subunit
MDYLQTLIETDEQLYQVWIAGEVSSAHSHASGLFFTLQDPESAAALNAVVWKSQLNQLVAMPVVGEQLLVLGRIRIYASRSQFQIVAWQCLPAGEGLRSLRFQQLRARLQAEGLFDPERKRALPSHPHTIAVVTSPQAAAWGDIQRTLKRAYPGLRVLFSAAVVQGEQAPASIVKAIARVARDGRAQVLVLSRGGGAKEDLACFNDERVVRAIATCPIPVIAGIGHQRDESLADLVADVCAHTPTAAAALAVPVLADLVAAHRDRQDNLLGTVLLRLRRERDRLGRVQQQLRPVLIQRQFAQESQYLQTLRQRLLTSGRQRLTQAQQHMAALNQTLDALDPKAVLQRGYAIVRQERKPRTRKPPAIVRSTTQVKPGDRLVIDVADGQIQVQVSPYDPLDIV